jgi:hypothetical protein
LDTIVAFLDAYLYLLFAGLLAIGFIFWLIIRNLVKNKNIKTTRNVWSYLFIWPILLTKKEGDKSVQRSFTRREWIGWLIFAVIVLLAIILTPTTRGR